MIVGTGSPHDPSSPTKRSIPTKCSAHVRSHQAGAVVLFLGTAREFTAGAAACRWITSVIRRWPRPNCGSWKAEARRRWTLVEVCIVHRVGHLELGEISVAIAVSSAHRQAAFEAGQWLIDRLKQVVPIWKKEHWADGTTQWIHPGTEHENSSLP